MASETSAETKQFFRELAARRKRLGIVQERWHVLFDTAALQSMNEYFHSFKVALGKERAVDYLIWLMMLGYEALEAVRKVKSDRKQKRSSSNKGRTQGKRD